ncbi:MAG: serine protease, partial [Verrucomicrobia bacterium]|nr:serine protease [Verrucomicrobiota bacterium]
KMPAMALLLLPSLALQGATGEMPKITTNEVHAVQARIARLNPPAPPQLGEPINDKSLRHFIEVAGQKILDEGRTIKDWGDKLDRKAVVLKLPAPSSRKLTPARLGQKIELAVAVVGVFYVCDNCSNTHLATASGFFLNESGALATCRHVLASYRKQGKGVVVMTRNGRLCPVREVLAVDPLHDLLVLQVEGRGFTPLPLANQALAGSPVLVVSHPENHFYMLTTGVVARYGVEHRPQGLFHSLEITADFAKGSSGAPVCNEAGAVVGLVDNTESIYYSTDHDQQNNLQMVVRNCAPSQSLLDMVTKH